MMTLDEVEKKMCSMAVELVELEVAILNDQDNDSQAAAEQKADELRAEYYALVERHPDTYRQLKQRLSK